MKFIMLTVANDFVIPRHNIIIPIENIIEATGLEEQCGDEGITEIVIKYNNVTSDYIVEESIYDIYRMLEE